MKFKLIFFYICLLLSFKLFAKTIVVKNQEELVKANKEAKPGDIVILKNGEWNNTFLKLNCNGTKEKPITFKAETPGKVLITGNSKLQLGGSYITVDGLYFTKGYAGDAAIINFRIDQNQLANNCRVTNTVINDFNNPKRLDENYWISFYGKNNRLDHCSFLNKKNIGVLLAVILDDERSRENFHSIDHNYFGVRLPLASNGGEIIRVGVSQHCEFNSNTQIVDNFFEHCDGEGEIISIKSGNNIIRNNLFKECQGAVVLRHGNYNTVENNIFFGNNKEGTGGIRIINKGQWVVNNLFYKCRGEGFRSPLSIMNGVPNSPANRYVAVSEAVVTNNSFIECSTISFCEGSDTERSASPKNVQFLNNIFYNTKDTQLCRIYDDISGINFSGNLISKTINQYPDKGFIRSSFTTQKNTVLPTPVEVNNSKHTLSDSLKKLSNIKLSTSLSTRPGFVDIKKLQGIKTNALIACGAKWYKNQVQTKNELKIECRTANELEQLLAKKTEAALSINLTGNEYVFSSPLTFSNDILITSSSKTPVKISMRLSNADFFIQLKAGKTLQLRNLLLDLSSLTAKTFIITDTSGSANHSNFYMTNCSISNSSATFFTAAKSSVSDSIYINNCVFSNGKGLLFNFTEEKDRTGYYNAEKLIISDNNITNHIGQLLAMLRGGNDESTMGPVLNFSRNMITDCFTEKNESLININGTQRSLFENNNFINCNTNKQLLLFEDQVRAVHMLRNNVSSNSGNVITNKYVTGNNNVIN